MEKNRNYNVVCYKVICTHRISKVKKWGAILEHDGEMYFAYGMGIREKLRHVDQWECLHLNLILVDVSLYKYKEVRDIG